MAQLTMQSDHPVPRPEDEGLSLEQIKLIPLFVPMAALLMAICGMLVMSMA